MKQRENSLFSKPFPSAHPGSETMLITPENHVDFISREFC
jgi:hypothetical protein